MLIIFVKKNKLSIFLFLFIFFANSKNIFAQNSLKSNIIINAEKMYRDISKNTAELEGKVQIVFKQKHLSCNKAKIFFNENLIVANGNVSLLDQTVTINAEKIEMNYKTGQGTLYNAQINSGQINFKGDVILKGEEENQYIAKNAEYTACTNCPPSWSFSGSNINAKIGGYAYIKNTILKIHSVPIFWLPYLIVPLKSSRQTGLLFPKFDFSSSTGITISQSLFWAISHNQDSTITLKHNKKWSKMNLNYRYVLNPTSKGIFDTAYLNEKLLSTSSDKRLKKFLPSSQDNIDRWFTRYHHYYELPEGFIHRLQLNFASDLQYSKDFSEDTLNHGDSAMENRMSITKNTSYSHLSLDSSYFINLLKADPFASNNDAIHKFPEIHYSIVDRKIKDSNFYFNFDVNYVNFARNTFTYDDMSVVDGERFISNSKNDPQCFNYPDCQIVRDGKYDKNIDQIRTGQRLNIQPSISYPLRISNYLDIFPVITYRETYYSFGIGDDPNYQRSTLRTRISALTSFNKIYGDLNDSQSTRYKHEIQPEIILTTMPWFNQPEHPFFGLSDKQEVPFFKANEPISNNDVNGINGIQFDYSDRLYDRNLLTFMMSNKFTKKLVSPSGIDYKRIATIKIFQSYDIYEANIEKENRRPWSSLTSIFDVRLNKFDTYSIIEYFPYHKISNISSRLRYKFTSYNWIQLGITNKFIIGEPTNVDYSTRTEDYDLASGFDTKFLNFMGDIVYSAVNKEIKAWYYMARFKVPGNCWSFDFIHGQKTGEAEPKFSFQFYFSFDGSYDSYNNPNMINLN